MPSYSSWKRVKCSGNRRLLTGILKEDLGFQGFLISDYAAIEGLPGNYKQQITGSVNARMDMVMVASHYQEFFAKLKESAEDGTVPPVAYRRGRAG